MTGLQVIELEVAIVFFLMGSLMFGCGVASLTKWRADPIPLFQKVGSFGACIVFCGAAIALAYDVWS